MDTIFALSSGAPPAGIAVIRISGPLAGRALELLAGRIPEPRRLALATLRGAAGVLDRALIAYFPGPATATGEDLAELHLHGGRAVVAAVERALAAIDGLRRAEPGEFTRRAFAHGRLDLAEAEGLADLLTAETEVQRRSALAIAGGELSNRVESWRQAVLGLSAQVEAVLDFGDEDDVTELPEGFGRKINDLGTEIAELLTWPAVERLREGFRVALAGPPNAGKSTLFNALVEDEAAITSSIAGTTRDVIERPVALGGMPVTFVDMAGLREVGGDAVETVGIARARAELARADLVLWLGAEGMGPEGAWEIDPQSDRTDRDAKAEPRFVVSAVSGDGMVELKRALQSEASAAMPRPGSAALSARQRALLADSVEALEQIDGQADPLLVAEHLRQARAAFDSITGRAATDDMLDTLFGRFCIGK